MKRIMENILKKRWFSGLNFNGFLKFKKKTVMQNFGLSKLFEKCDESKVVCR